MPTTLSSANEKALVASLADTSGRMPPEVVALRYEIDEDSVGELAIWIWVEIADAVPVEETTWDRIAPIRQALLDAVEATHLEIRPYIRFTDAGEAPTGSEPIAA